MADRPFRFGAKAKFAASAGEWRDLARRAEDLGYGVLSIDDHVGAHVGPQLAPFPALIAAAGATTTIELATMVAAVDFRSPVMLGLEAATVDLLTEQRFRLGLGAGWSIEDYAALGQEWDPPVARLDRLEETVAILRGVWSGEPFSFAGRHHTIGPVTGAPVPPRPIPLMIGGGARRILGIAGRTADVVGINPAMVSGAIDARSLASASVEAMDRCVEWVRTAVAVRPEPPVLAMQLWVAVVTEDPEETVHAVAQRFGLPPDAVRVAPYFQIGPENQIVEELLSIRERYGISEITFGQSAFEPLAPVVAKLSGS